MEGIAGGGKARESGWSERKCGAVQLYGTRTRRDCVERVSGATERLSGAERLCKMRTSHGVTYTERGRGADEVYGVQGVVRREKRV